MRYPTPRSLSFFSLCTLIAALLTGCGREEPTAYKIPKEAEETFAPEPAASTSQPAASRSSNMQVLPGMQEAAAEAGSILYTTPEGWTDLPASGIRKAHIQVNGEAGNADLTITAFPGDVGGLLANINRWRGQIGLPPATVDQLPAFTEQISIFQHSALYVRLDNAPESIAAAIMPFHGYTWFIKLQGPSPTVFENEATFKEFLQTIQMEGHSH